MSYSHNNMQIAKKTVKCGNSCRTTALF